MVWHRTKESYPHKISNGMQFGRWTVIEANCGYVGSHRLASRVLCDCGIEKIVMNQHLLGGVSRSCGCLNREKASERMTIARAPYKRDIKNVRLYRIWRKMKHRCSSPKLPNAESYFLKGVRVCQEWYRDYEAFQEWALSHGYNDTLSIDRIDNDGDYCPENCRWATLKEQHNNMSNNRRITYMGRTQTLAQWCDELHLNYARTKGRLRAGWNVSDAFTCPRLAHGRTLAWHKSAR